MGAEITSRGFTQPGPLNHGEVQAAASDLILRAIYSATCLLPRGPTHFDDFFGEQTKIPIRKWVARNRRQTDITTIRRCAHV